MSLNTKYQLKIKIRVGGEGLVDVSVVGIF